VYLLDFLLAEIKDNRTPLLEECTCYRKGVRTGVVDYFVSIHGIWFPVEAKLNLSAERDLRAQVSKYVHIDAFVPQKGPHRGKRFEAQESALCVVIDQQGIYLLSDRVYAGCRPGTPLWRREELAQRICGDIRTYLARCHVTNGRA
jgi:hypothetical protein